MSRRPKHYDVKQLRQRGCVPATRDIVRQRFIAMLASLALLIKR